MPQLNAALPIVKDDGTMEAPFRDQMNVLNRYLPITGVGSPEGVVEALQYSLYLDTTGVTGSIEYRKMLPAIAGDTKMGWVAV
jgi:hypothetical protein